MSFLTQVDEDDEAVAALFEADRASQGYVANYTRTFAARPAVLRAWQDLVAAVRQAPSLRRYEMATLGAATALRSSYCSLAHGAVVAEQVAGPAAVAALATGAQSPELDPVDRAVAGFAAKVARDAPGVTADDVQALRDLGLADDEVLDVVLVTAARCFFSTVLDATGTLPDAALRDRLGDLAPLLTVGRPIEDRPPDGGGR